MTARVFRVLLVVFAAGLFYGSLYPWEFRNAQRWGGLFYRGAFGRAAQLDVVLNLLVYMPLGFCAAMAFRTWWGRALACIATSAMSLGIEYAQLWVPTRDGNLRDFYWNCAGTLLGLMAGVWVNTRLRVDRIARLWHRDRAAWMLLGFWVLWQWFPFVPSLRIARLQSLIAAWMAPTATFLQMGDALSIGIVLALLARSAGAPLAGAVVPFVLIGRGFIVGRTLPLPVFLLVLAGFALGWWLRARLMIPAIALTTWILLRELYPLTFSRVAARFHWNLFSTILEAERMAVIPILAGKFFLYTATLWTLRAAGTPLWIATSLMCLLLALCEWLQRFLPGRTPELTDIALTLAGAALLALFGHSSVAVQKIKRHRV